MCACVGEWVDVVVVVGQCVRYNLPKISFGEFVRPWVSNSGSMFLAVFQSRDHLFSDADNPSCSGRSVGVRNC